MYIIANYMDKYKPVNSKGGELVHAKYVKMPVKPRGKGLRALLKQPEGLEVFAIWSLLLQAATETNKPAKRGMLLNHRDEPASVDEIADSISLDGKSDKVKQALDALVELGWINYVPDTERVRTKGVPNTEDGPHKISKDKLSKDKKREVKELSSPSQKPVDSVKDEPVAKTSKQYTEEFEQFWQAYPRKIEKEKFRAYGAWLSIDFEKEEGLFELILLRLKQLAGDEIPKPHEWLNKRMWIEKKVAAKG